MKSGSRRGPEARGRTRSLAGNATTLYIAHFLGLVVPLVAVPYLARVLRPEGWGLVLFAQSFGVWWQLVQEYGFDLSGTRALARMRDDPASVAEAVRGIQSAKTLVLLLGFPLVLGVFLAVPLFRENPRYLLWAWLFAGVRGFSPNWYFMGQERMAPAAYLEAAGRVAAAMGVFFLVHAPGDGWRVLALQAVAMAVSVAVLTVWMHREVPFLGFRFDAGFRTLKEGAGIFLFRTSSGLYMQANPFILGLLAPAPVVAFFAGAEKLVRAAIGLIQPLSQTFFPRLSHLVESDRKGAAHFFRLSLLGIGGLGVIMGLGAFFGAELLVKVLLGPGYEEAVPILRAFSLLPPIIGVGTVFGIQWALPAGLERPFFRLVLMAGLLNVALAFVLVPVFQAKGMVVSVLVAELVVAGGLVMLFRWKGGTLRPLLVPPRLPVPLQGD